MGIDKQTLLETYYYDEFIAVLDERNAMEKESAEPVVVDVDAEDF